MKTRTSLLGEPPLCHEDHRQTTREGQDQLGNFIDPEVAFPVLVTTSRLLSTGVDAQTCGQCA